MTNRRDWESSSRSSISRLAVAARVDRRALLECLCVLFASLSAIGFGEPAQANAVDGAWSPVADWPLISIHAALTPDGRVLTYGTDGAGEQTGYFIYDIWDPTAGLGGGHVTLQNMTLTDIFCSSQIILPQSGEILIAGGDNWTGSGTTNSGNNNSNLFDFGDNSLARSANMNRSRWYSSSTALVNGEIYIQGGSGGADRPEVRGASGGFRLLTGANTSGYATLFPRNFLSPDGRVFGYDTNGKMYFVDTDGDGSLATAGQYSSSNAGWTSGAAMYRPGKILQMGGNSNGAVVIDISGPQPVVTPTQSMSSQRRWVSATVLADGQVLATGGSRVDNQLTDVNNRAEIWNPGTGQWHAGPQLHAGPSAAPARLYHSSALLLPDATVLVAGGGAPGPQVNTNAEIYQPPYLFNSSGNLATRPVIQSAPDTANVGDSLALQVDATISRITLVKSGSVTHSVNMDQRFIELPFSASGNMLQVDLPVRASDTPPGYYMMFAISNNGVPSVASMLRINVDSSPNLAVDYTPTIGGGGGGTFQLACPVDEIVVGVHGKFATYVNQIGAQCAKVDQLGRWIGNPTDGPVTGTTTAGTSFSKTCPRDHAVSGFRGRSGQYVNQIDIQCRALTGTGALTGNAQYLGGSGGSGGTAQGPLSCGTNNPVYALYGRSGGWLDSFGVQCRQAVITPVSINSSPVIVNPGAQSGTVGVPVDLQISASDGDGDDLSFTATGLPNPLQIDPITGRITGTPGTAGVFNATVTVSDGTEIDTADFDWDIAAVIPLSVDPMPPQDAVLANIAKDYTANANNGLNVVYKWEFGDGTAETSYSSSASISHVFAGPGVYFVTLTVDDAIGEPISQTFAQRVHLPQTTNKPANSSNFAYEERGGSNPRLWVVNQDNDSISVFDAVTNTKLAELDVGSEPRAVALAPDGRAWVSNKSSASISVIDPTSLLVDQVINLPYASAPYGIVFSPVENEAFVTLEATGQLMKLDATSGGMLAIAAAGPNPRHLSINAAGSSVYVSRFVTPRQPGEQTATVLSEIGGEVYGGEILAFDSSSMSLQETIVLQHSDKDDAENQGRGVPNYLGAMTISPDGTNATVPSKQDNIARGTLRSGANINFQNTVRAISSRIDLATDSEDYSGRIDHDNASMASAVAFDPLGIYSFVSLETSREIAVLDVHGGFEMFRIDTGRAPRGVAVSADGLRLFVSNFMDRSVSVFDLTELQELGQWDAPLLATLQNVSSEKLSLQVLLGKQLFYDARDTRLARDRYLSCASCHNDGSGDGRVWDLTGMGEGLRNTIKLRGTSADDGRLHWSENFDEVQDFEEQIRELSEGTGLMTNADFNAGTRSEPLGDPKAGLSADLDALAAYVASLNEFADSPHRNGDGSLTANAILGRDVFRRENCAACHSGVEFTDSDMNTLHDIGTIKPSSGSRLNGPLTGIDTPTLRGVWNSGPYLHDGSAESLADAVAAHNNMSLNAGDMTSLVAYLAQIDSREPSAPLPNIPPTLTNPGAQAHETGDSVSLAIQANDADGDSLSYLASGLPAGLSINASGVISGTPTAAGNHTVTVTVDDGEDSAGTSFSWSVTIPNTPPTLTNPGAQAHETGDSVSLAIQANDADGDSLSYLASGLPAGLSINASGVISGTPTAAGNHTATVTVDDGEDSAGTSFSWSVTIPNTPPTLTNPGAQAHETGDSVSLTIHANDTDGDSLSYLASGLPAGLSINASGVISGTPTAAGNHTATVTVDDGEDTASASFSWSVTIPNTPPTLTNPGAQAHETGDSVSLAIQANDADGDSLSYSASGLPAGLSVNTSGVISGTPTAAGNHTVTVTVDDGEDSAGASFSWTVSEPNVPPSLTSPGPQLGEIGDSASLQIQASDADGGTLNYSATGLPAGLGISGATGLISGTLTTAGAYTVSVIVDDGEDMASAGFSWTVTLRNTPPNLTNPGPQSNKTGDVVSIQIQSSDADGDSLIYGATGLPAGLAMNPVTGIISGTPTNAVPYNVSVSVHDGKDSSSATFTWEVENSNSPPTVKNPGQQSHETGRFVTLTLEASDVDGDSLTYDASGLPVGLSIDAVTGIVSGTPTTANSYNVTLNVNDGDDNASTSFVWDIVQASTSPTSDGTAGQAEKSGGGGSFGLLWLLALSLLTGYRRALTGRNYYEKKT